MFHQGKGLQGFNVQVTKYTYTPTHYHFALDLCDELIQGSAEVKYTTEITYAYCGHEVPKEKVHMSGSKTLRNTDISVTHIISICVASIRHNCAQCVHIDADEQCHVTS